MFHKEKVSRRFLLKSALGATGQLGIAGSIQNALAQEEAHSSRQATILVNLRGGLSQLDSFDPKPTAPAEFRGEFSPIATTTPGVQFAEHLPLLASEFGHFAVIRSFCHNTSVHSLAQSYVMTGDQFTKAPAMGAVVVDQIGWQVPPVYVAIPDMPPNAGLLGPNCDPYNLLGDGGELLKVSPHPQDKAATLDLQKRIALLESLDGRFNKAGVSSEVLEVRRTAYRQTTELIDSQALRQAVNLELESPKSRERYGADRWSQYLLLARRLVEAGSRFIAVTFDDRGGFGTWDTHRDNFKDLKQFLPRLDHALATLFRDLWERGMLETTQVIVLGEMGRTPKVNANAGRDHWPKAMSMLWAGGGVRGGRVIGATDDSAAAPVTRPIGPKDVAFSVLSRMGVDPAVVTMPPSGRRILPNGEVIKELVG